jgi:hypothetical protein
MSLKKSKISRLDFLKVSGFAAAGLALTACGDSTPTTAPAATTAASAVTTAASATTAAGAATTAAGAATTAATGTTAAATTAAPTTAAAAAPKGSPTPELAKAGSGGTELTYVVWGGTAGPAKEYTTITSVYPDMAKQYSLSLISAGTGDADVANSFRLALAASKNIPDIITLNRI